MNLVLILFFTVFVAISGADTHAGIYKHVDKDGHITYSNKPIRGANKLQATPSSPKYSLDSVIQDKNLPRVSEKKQTERDTKRRQILENELATEKKLLTDTKKNLISEKKIRVSITNPAQSQHDVIKYEEEIKKRISLHKRNITALEKELVNR